MTTDKWPLRGVAFISKITDKSLSAANRKSPVSATYQPDIRVLSLDSWQMTHDIWGE